MSIDTHPGHDPEAVDAVVNAWREEFGVGDGDAHVFIGEPDAYGNYEIRSLTSVGKVLVDRLISCGMISGIQ